MNKGSFTQEHKELSITLSLLCLPLLPVPATLFSISHLSALCYHFCKKDSDIGWVIHFSNHRLFYTLLSLSFHLHPFPYGDGKINCLGNVYVSVSKLEKICILLLSPALVFIYLCSMAELRTAQSWLVTENQNVRKIKCAVHVDKEYFWKYFLIQCSGVKGVICNKWPKFEGSSKTIAGSITASYYSLFSTTKW